MLQRVCVAVVSDSPVVEAGLAGMLSPTNEAVKFLLGWRPDAETTTRVDVVLVDVSSGERDQLDAPLLRSLTRNSSVGAVALYASDLPDALRQSAKRFGIRSFLAKELSAPELVAALITIADGHIVDKFVSRGGSEAWFGRAVGLTERESQVLILCAQGLSNREIGDALYISPETVRTHMKSAYARIGVRNRVEATAFVHSRRTTPKQQLVEEGAFDDADVPSPNMSDPREHSAPTTTDRVPLELIIDEADLGARLRLAGIGDTTRHVLRPVANDASEIAGDFAQRMVRKWLEHGPTATVLTGMTHSHLTQFLENYVNQLFNEEFDRLHAEEMLRAGAAHHRLQLAPQWLIASFAFLVSDFVDIMFDTAASPGEAIERTVAALSSVFFDAGLVLDAYEVCVERDLLRQAAQTRPLGSEPPAAVAPPSSNRPPTPRPQSLLHVPLSPDEVSVRRSFLELSDEDRDELNRMNESIRDSIASVLDSFYGLVAGSESISALVSEEMIERLTVSVGRYWSDLASERFDPVRAAARMRIGIIHESIGLQPQYYLAGLACQVNGLLRALPAGSPNLRTQVSTLVRVAFFDATFVLDAYMDARAKSLLQIGRFAGQVVAGLANGVVIVDSRDRVEYANNHLLDLLGIDAGVLHRLPVDRAIPIDGIRGLLGTARSDPDGRASMLSAAWGRNLRVTAIRLKQSPTGRSGLLALVLDDISDIIRANAEQASERQRNEHILASVNAMVWEIDTVNLTVLAISRGSSEVTGYADIDLLGRQTLVELLGHGDPVSFIAQLRDMHEGDRRVIDHVIARHDNTTRRVRTSLVATRSPLGNPTVSGVTLADDTFAKPPTQHSGTLNDRANTDPVV